MLKKQMKVGKRSFRRRRVRFRRSRRSKNQLKGELMVYYPRNNISLLPPRYRTKIKISNYFSAATGAGNNPNQLNVFLNVLNHPFNSTITNLTVRGSAVATQNPTGMTQLLNVNTYQQYRVYASACEVDCFPGNLSDQVLCTLTPSITVQVPASVQVGLGAPYTRKYEANASRTSNGNRTLKNFISVHKLIGTTQRAIEDDLSARFTGSYVASPTVQLFWVFNADTLDGAVYNSAAGFRVTVTYYVEFFGIESATMIQT